MTGQPIRLELQPRIEAALAALREGTGEHCLSDWSFSNLYLFRDVHCYRFIDGEWPGVSGLAYDGATHFFPLFDPGRAPIAVLRALIQAHGCLYPVSPSSAAALPGDAFRISASRDDADYLYAASAFARYEGRALAKKRNLLRQFLSAHSPSCMAFSERTADAAREVLQGWMAQKSKAAGEADQQPCLEAIAHAGRFDLQGQVFLAEGRPIGFLLAQTLQPGVQAIRFAKGLHSHDGIYPWMFQHFARSFGAQSGRPVEWLNFEQDMGIVGFRRSKMSYAPHALLPKLRVHSASAQDLKARTA
ncbi:hypothetical protein SRS16CHR_05303 [Variovorax sp. SRS16]|uniref:phosphatidylglycerol lysyltransferase domain-containing protein n=1 Tax=Variovorax sp. SRS16 TaxID=282217 RepID=UPI00131825E6|nr:phosphatidylglycerol lysyltransferase domain-containing protein [Variovorax sp. SRS16]VTU33522.1 hypothetical protein SRS16CHR_05303 [Variovorax sp. SRS16]